MAARQFLRMMNESATGQGADFGNYVEPETPVINTDFINVHLINDNACTVRKTPNQVEMRSWNSLNRRIKTVSGTYGVSGQIVTYLYSVQVPFWINLLTLNGTTNNLPSFAIDHALELNDDSATILRKRYVGCKIAQAVFATTADQQVTQLTLDIVGQRLATDPDDEEFPEPAVYPTTRPYVFGDLASPGWFKTSNTSRAEFNAMTLTIQNILDASQNELPYVSRIKHCGRNVTLNTDFVHVSNADRAAFEAATEQTNSSVKFNNGTNSLTFTLGNVVTTGVEDQLSLDKITRQSVTMFSQYDGTTDLVMAYA